MEQPVKEFEAMVLRLTPQRRAILGVLQVNAGKHLSAEEIHDLVKKGSPGLGLATVYRTLELLVDAAIAHRLDFGDGRARYELARQEEHQHHHLVCVECGTISEVNADLLQRLEEMVEAKNGFTVTDHHLKLYGYCRRCREQREKARGKP
jgi:Fur family ferric uptake transcriptional regulator